MGDEGAHPQLMGAGQRVAEVLFCLLREIGVGGDLPEEPERPPFVGALPTLAGKCEGSPGQVERVLEPAGDGMPSAARPESVNA